MVSPTILFLVGKTGVGKSSLVNSFAGETLAHTDPFEPCTQVVERYAQDTPWGPAVLVDTPGLAEADESRNRQNAAIIRDVWRTLADRSPRLVYVTSLDQPRFLPEESTTIRAICEAIESRPPQNLDVVFTFAGRVPSSLYVGRHQHLFQRVVDDFETFSNGIIQRPAHYVMCDNLDDGWCRHGVPISQALMCMR